MRLLIVIPAISNVYGGTSKAVLDIAQSLHSQGMTIDIVTTNANGSQQLDVPLKQWIRKSEYRIQYFPYTNFHDYKWSSSFAIWLFQNIPDYDLVHSNAIFSFTNFPVYWTCRYYHIPYVVTPHGMLEPWALSHKGWKKRLYYLLVERPALKRAQVIQALAIPEAENLWDLKLKVPIVIIPNGIHIDEYRKLSDTTYFYQQFPQTQDKILILFLGRIDPKKGLDLLAKSFSQVITHFSNAHLIIAGPDNIGFLPRAKEYFREADCLDFVTFTGMISGTLKQAALAAADVYIAPSYSEGFSISILEGMASGLPCIITTGCNFPEANTAQAAYIVEPNAENLGTALKHCLEHPATASQIGLRAQKFIFKNYNWNKIASSLIEVYDAIINDKFIPAQYTRASHTTDSDI